MLNQGKVIMSCSMNDFSGRYIEVCANEGASMKLSNMGPLSCRKEAGKDIFIFDGISEDSVFHLGDLGSPSIADVFVGIVGRRGEV